jgi:DNA-binding IclR family transcriptional regulator
LINSAVKRKAKYPIQSLEKALEVIEVLYNSGQAMGISDIDEHVDIGKSTVHRVLDTLLSYNYIEQVEDSTKYRLSWKFFEVGQSIPVQRNLLNLNTDALQSICDKYGESVNMGIHSDDSMIIISRVVPRTNMAANVPIGSKMPLHASSMGKIAICEFDEAEIRKLYPNNDLFIYTPNTIQTVDELVSQLAKIKQQGYAIDDQELYSGITCIAAPIKDFSGKTVAGVSVSGTSSRMTHKKIFEVLEELDVACKEMSAFLGYGQ